MPVIAFANKKGGVAKTTSTILMGEALSQMGYKVEVRDIDPTGSATEWAQSAIDHGCPLPFDVYPANMRTVSIPADPSTWVLIDTPPSEMQIVQAGIDAADLVIVVTTPGKIDVSHAIETASCVNGFSSILVTQARPHTIAKREALQTLEEHEMMGFETVIPDLQSILRASGTNKLPSMSGYQEAACELVDMWD